METLLVDNESNTHGALIAEGFRTAKEILICVAFLKSSGFDALKESLRIALKNGAQIKMIVGLDFYVTDPNALWEAFKLFESYKKSEFLLCKQSVKATFHPKLYFWRRGRESHIVIGSANLTNGGLSQNVELSVVQRVPSNSDFAEEVSSFFERIKECERVECADAINLAQYEARHGIYSAKLKKAKSDADREASSMVNINDEKRKKYLASYRSNLAQQRDWAKKRVNYRKARKLLDRIADSTIANKTEFLALYEMLVGAKGKSTLWHSGGLFRSKNEVVKNYKRVQSLIRALRSHASEDVADVFDRGMRGARKIPGLGINVVTEILNTLAPTRFSVLNNNSNRTLKHLGLGGIGTIQKSVTAPAHYSRFNELIKTVAEKCDFRDLAQADHFLNYIYWRKVRRK